MSPTYFLLFLLGLVVLSNVGALSDLKDGSAFSEKKSSRPFMYPSVWANKLKTHKAKSIEKLRHDMLKQEAKPIAGTSIGAKAALRKSSEEKQRIEHKFALRNKMVGLGRVELKPTAISKGEKIVPKMEKGLKVEETKMIPNFGHLAKDNGIRH